MFKSKKEREKEEELFDIEMFGGFFILVIELIIILEVGFYEAYHYNCPNLFYLYFFLIMSPICVGVFFVFIIKKLWDNYKEKYLPEGGNDGQ